MLINVEQLNSFTAARCSDVNIDFNESLPGKGIKEGDSRAENISQD